MFDGKKLTKIMKEKKLTNAKLAEMVTEYGVMIKEDSFKAYRQGRASPRMEVFDAIARVLDVPEQELFENSEEQKEIIAKKEIKENIDRYQEILQDAKDVCDGMASIAVLPLNPTIDDVRDTSHLDRVFIDSRVVTANTMGKIDKYTTIMRVVGNAMSPKINEDDILMLDMVAGRKFVNVDGTYYVRYGDAMQIKKVQFLGNNQINIISANDEYPPFNPTTNGIDWEILGKPIAKFIICEYSKLEII